MNRRTLLRSTDREWAVNQIAEWEKQMGHDPNWDVAIDIEIRVLRKMIADYNRRTSDLEWDAT